MCGIIGYVGTKDATGILLECLKRLEYRGYDSSGLGLIANDQSLIVRKAKGKIRSLEDLIKEKPVPFAPIGISHTRWATHGLPSDINSHPHTDSRMHFAVVHNGIIENYAALREALKKKGVHFVSQTDTEVIGHLIAQAYRGDFKEAVLKTIRQLKGAFALGVISHYHPDTLIAARVGSPLIVGLGEGENLIASDVPAILDKTRRVIYLEDGQMAVLTKDKAEVFDFAGKAIKFKINTVSFSLATAEKDGYPHFMLKEIHEQPDVMEKMLKFRLPRGRLNLEGLYISPKRLKAIKRITIIACGTAYHAGLVGKYVIEEWAGLGVDVDTSSEFRYRNPIVDKHTLVVAISQSGETADTLAAVREAKKKGATIVSICNVIGSSLARESDGVLYTHAGPEIGVASTKAYTAQLMMIYVLALALATFRQHLKPALIKAHIKTLNQVPGFYREILKKKSTIEKISESHSHFGCFLFLGRHINVPTALEGALKLKEISYIPAEGYAAGEMKHGPIALIDEYRAVVCVAPQSHVYEKMASNIQEIKARKGCVLAIATQGDEEIKHHADHVIYIPALNEMISPILTVLPLQLIAYFIAVKRGNDVDQPRNLAKSVTVE